METNMENLLSKIFTKQCKVATDGLIDALHQGDFENALHFVEEGADGTRVQKNRSNIHSDYIKPLDWLVANGNPDNENYHKDIFTPEQRIQIFDALVAKTKNPIDLVSDKTLNNALMWGCAEIIPGLVDIGVKIKDDHFVEAANPSHRRNKAIQTMAMVLPHVRYDVNVVNPYSKINAGHIVARNAYFEAFKWLEKNRLNKKAFAEGVWSSTYAHMLAKGSIHEDDSVNTKRIEFASYLVDNGYPIDTPGRDGTTPPECAMDEGQVGVALVYINADAGVEVKSKYLPLAIRATHFNKATAEDVIAIGEKLAEKGKMSKDTAVLAYKELFHIIKMDDNNLQQGFPIAAYLSSKGVTPREAVEKLLQEKDLPTDYSDTIKTICKQLEQAKKKYEKPKITQGAKPMKLGS